MGTIVWALYLDHSPWQFSWFSHFYRDEIGAGTDMAQKKELSPHKEKTLEIPLVVILIHSNNRQQLIL